MALKKTLAERLFKFTKISNQYITNCRVSSSLQARTHPNPGQPRPDPGDNAIFRRLFHKRAIFSPDLRQIPVGQSLIEKIRGFDIVKDRIRLDGLSPPPAVTAEQEVEAEVEEALSMKDARKLLRVAQLEMVKLKLREMGKTWISYSDFLRVCGEGCSDPEYGIGVARTLDESGTVIVLGNVVLLKPEQENETFVVTRQI